MKTKYPFDILIIGVYSSWFLGFLITLILSFAGQEYPDDAWYLLAASLLVFWVQRLLDRSEDQSKLALAESVFLALNMVIVIYALGFFMITFSPFWFAKDVRYFSLALGLPSLIAVLCWKLRKNRMTGN